MTEWTVEARPHGQFLLSAGGYPVAMLSPAAPGHIIDTAKRIAEALNALERFRAADVRDPDEMTIHIWDEPIGPPGSARTPRYAVKEKVGNTPGLIEREFGASLAIKGGKPGERRP